MFDAVRTKNPKDGSFDVPVLLIVPRLQIKFCYDETLSPSCCIQVLLPEINISQQAYSIQI